MPLLSQRAHSHDWTGNRFTGYADGGRVIFQDDGLSRNIWVNGYECCAASELANVPHGIIFALQVLILLLVWPSIVPISLTAAAYITCMMVLSTIE